MRSHRMRSNRMHSHRKRMRTCTPITHAKDMHITYANACAYGGRGGGAGDWGPGVRGAGLGGRGTWVRGRGGGGAKK